MADFAHLESLFSGGGFRFSLRLTRQDLIRFWLGRSVDRLPEKLLAERARWLDGDPDRYAVLSVEGQLVLDAFVERGNEEGFLSGEVSGENGLKCIWLGKRLVPDFVLLRVDGKGEFRLCGGCVCFPSGWDLPSKLGQRVSDIHGVVPGLNHALAPAIDRFLKRLRPKEVYFRQNWGLSSTPERNNHPQISRPVLTSDMPLDQVWLRVEHQCFLPLPEVGGIVFGILLEVVPVSAVAENRAIASGLAEELRTMPAEMALYKGVDKIRWSLADRLLSKWL